MVGYRSPKPSMRVRILLPLLSLKSSEAQYIKASELFSLSRYIDHHYAKHSKYYGPKPQAVYLFLKQGHAYDG